MGITRRTAIATLLSASLTALFSLSAAAADKKITLGFAQIGAESEWRTANTESIKSPPRPPAST